MHLLLAIVAATTLGAAGGCNPGVHTRAGGGLTHHTTITNALKPDLSPRPPTPQ